MSHFERNIRLTLFLVLPVLGFFLGWSLSQKSNSSSIITPSDINDFIEIPETINPPQAKKLDEEHVDLDIFWETWNVLNQNFLDKDELKTADQVYGATKGMVTAAGDPYTVFMTPEDTAKFNESMKGEFEGIGAEIAIKNDRLTIVAPLKNSPAELAGIQAGDIVVAIDDEATFGMSSDEAVTKIRGPKGEKVVLTIVREGEKKSIDITIVRDTIVVDALDFKMEDDVAVVTLSQFGVDTAQEFQEVVEEILLNNPRGIVIDLRNNGGGLLAVCVRIATEFFEEQVIATTRGRKLGNSEKWVSGKDGSFLDVPLIILTNRGSASASEIFAGAVQDYDRGLLIGEQTFGKGSVQNVIELSDGSSLKVTVSEWLTPKGRSIINEGITPDEIVEVTDEDIENDVDPVLQRALGLIGTDEMREIIKNKNLHSATTPEDKVEELIEEVNSTHPETGAETEGAAVESETPSEEVPDNIVE